MPTASKKVHTVRFIRKRCEHPSSYLEPCSDGFYCVACCEGVCPWCRRLWADDGPRCQCQAELDSEDTDP